MFQRAHLQTLIKRLEEPRRFIVKSQARFDIGYRQQLYSTMKERTAPNGVVFKFEYLFFNVFK